MTPNAKLEAFISNKWYRKVHMSPMWGNHKRNFKDWKVVSMLGL
jgi:hypothetical protein